MRALKIILLFWLLGMLAMWIRDGRGFCVAETLPFVERQQHFSRTYELQALIAIVIGAWGVWMLSRRSHKATSQTGGPGRFRSAIIFVPLLIIAIAGISQRIRPGVRVDDLVGPNWTMQNVYLAVLCIVIYGIVLAFKFFGNQK